MRDSLPYSRVDRFKLRVGLAVPSPWRHWPPSDDDAWFTRQHNLPRFPMQRVWWFKPCAWQTLAPVMFGGDEFGRRTIVVNLYLFGAFVVPISSPDSAEASPVSVSERSDGPPPAPSPEAE